MGENGHTLCEALKVFLNTLKGNAASNLDDDTPLFASGLIDSLGLLQLFLWIEEKVGEPIDSAEYDLAEEWGTVAGIVSFIERQRQTNSQ